jgi:cytochrome c biogenesis protein ResB
VLSPGYWFDRHKQVFEPKLLYEAAAGYVNKFSPIFACHGGWLIVSTGFAIDSLLAGAPRYWRVIAAGGAGDSPPDFRVGMRSLWGGQPR